MLEPKASRFYQAALQSGLIDEAGLDECYAQIPAEKQTPDAIDRRLARSTISSGRLTLWQAQQILGGRSSGFKIDKYVLLDLLGRGGMGRVYLARDLRLNRLVALKVLSQERMNNPRAIARFHREAKVGAQLQHENLVRVYDEGEANGVRYLVMEYIEGKNVGQLIGELGQIPWPTSARLGRQIALGLDHARLKELIHRDVNPCNVLVTQDGSAKLTDLGLAIDLNEQDNVTREGATVGTFDYVSPEQARHSRSVDTRADIYSLGCTLYHMIAGRVPFPVVSLPEKLYAHQLHDPEPLTELAPGIPDGLSEVVLKMMRKLPEDRYQTPLEVAQALEPFAIATGWTSTPATSPSTSPSGSGINRVRPSSDVQARPKTRTVEMGAVVAEAPSSWISSLNPDRSGQPASGSEPKNSGSGTNSTPSGSGTSGSTGAGESFIPLDLGPEEPLSHGLNPSSKSRSKNKSKAKEKERAKETETETARAGATTGLTASKPGNSLIVAGLVGGVALVASLAVLATMVLSRPDGGEKGSTGTGNEVAIESENGKARSKGGGKSTTKHSTSPVQGDILVQFKDGTSEVVKTLVQAMGLASNRTGAEVILGDGPIRIENSSTIRVPSSGGLTIKAAEGARPILEVKLKGLQPMFFVNANLRLEGLRVVVRYETPSEALVFQVERDLTMDRCSFWAIGPAEGSRFALAEGSKVTVTGCLFEGFETALQVEANPGMSVILKQSIFLSAKAGDEVGGRAAKFHSLLGKGVGCRLLVEGCSIRSGTFLVVDDFSPTTPVEIDSVGSAFLVKTLLGYEGEPTMPLGTDSTVRWKGRDNRYNVTGPTWAGFAGAPADLESWSKQTSDLAAKALPLKLAKEPPDPTTPKDCALLDSTDKPVGADPDKVGPP
jgi:eukaryotic-like serine/threonine-protein kinase